jgi:hypothetical protein
MEDNKSKLVLSVSPITFSANSNMVLMALPITYLFFEDLRKFCQNKNSNPATQNDEHP